MARVVLVTVQPRNAATGAATTVRLAGGGNRKGYYYGGEHYRAGIATLPRLRASIDFDEQGWTGASLPTTGGLIWAPWSKARLAELAAYYWPRAAITVQEGDEDTEVFTTVLTGKVADAEVRDHKLVITVADLGDDLAKPLVTARFAGSGGAEGGSEAANRIKRRSWGRAFNVEGRVLDKANNIYEFGDPAFPWSEITTLRDMGRDASPAPTLVPWQGSIAATLTALVASSPVQGSGVVAPSIACCKWWTQPAGPLTADVKGEVGAGYVETVASIADRILAAASGPAITNVAAANGWRPEVAGIHVDEGETVAQALDRLLYGSSLLWPLGAAGTITLREITFTGPVETLRSDDVQRLRTLPPVKARRVGYQRAYRKHGDGEIAASLLTSSVDAGSLATEDYVYFSGPYLKEDAGGVTGATLGNFKTVLGTAAAITGQGALATVNSAAWGSQVSGRPTELTDGRIIAGLDAAGDLARDLTVPRSNSSNLLRRTTGGLFTGELAADVTLTHTAAAIVGQGAAATASFLAQFDPTAARAGDNILVDPLFETAQWVKASGIGYVTASAPNPRRYAWTQTDSLTLAPNQLIPGTVYAAGVFPVTPGERLFLSAFLKPENHINNGWLGRLYWLDAGGSILSADHITMRGGVLNTWTFQEYSAVAPAGAAACYCYFDSHVWAASGSGTYIAYPRLGRTERGATLGADVNANVYDTFTGSKLTVPRNEIRTPLGTAAGISGQGAYATLNSVSLEDGARITNLTRIGKLAAATGVASNSSILPANVLYSMIPALKDSVTISDTAAGATVTINIGSAVFYPDAGGTVTFPSGNVAGLAYNTKYYLKRTGVDPVSSPTGSAWSASTTLSVGVGDVYVGFYTTRASSGAPSPPPPPPPGGGQDCVWIEARVETRTHGWLAAVDVRRGDVLRVLSDDREGTTWEACTGVEYAHEACWLITSESGIRLTVSSSTPLTLRDGSIIRVPELDGQTLPVRDRSGFRWETCRAAPVGPRPVARIHCRQRTFAAGDVAGAAILTHNPNKP